jgi:hypothetical protein
MRTTPSVYDPGMPLDPVLGYRLSFQEGTPVRRGEGLDLAAPMGKQWVMSPRLSPWFSTGWARVKIRADGSTQGDKFELAPGQLVRVRPEPGPPGHVWVRVGAHYASIPIDKLEPAEPPPTRLERLVGEPEL